MATLKANAPKTPDTIEPNVTLVKAPDLWNLGFTGTGIVVGNQDTGMRWTHDALKPHYRGWDGANADHNYNWHDSIHADINGNGHEPVWVQHHGAVRRPRPRDAHDRDAPSETTEPGNQIGVAPGAKWIGCHNMDEGVGRPETYTECFQWFIAPTDLNGQNADPTKRPHVMNNSWGCPTSELCAPDSLQTIVENTTAAGIFVEVSAGNSGSGCNERHRPAGDLRTRPTRPVPPRGAATLFPRRLQQPRAGHRRRLEPDQA